MSTPKNKVKSVSYPVIMNENFITVIADRTLSITKEDARYPNAVALYRKGLFTELIDLLDQPAAIQRYTTGKVKVYDGIVTYNGEPVHGSITKRILDFLKQGLPFKGLVAFLNNLYENTNVNVRDRLYDFLEKNNLGITDRGSFVVFKLVNADGTPPYNKASFGKLLPNGKVVQVQTYEVGNTYVMPRENIREGGQCDSGALLYAGNQSYWNGAFNDKKQYTGFGRMLIAEVFPQDVGNVAGAEASKIATCKLHIVGEYQKVQELVTKALVKSSALGIKPSGQKFHNVRDTKGHFIKRKG